jgi:predicted small secreted protein
LSSIRGDVRSGCFVKTTVLEETDMFAKLLSLFIAALVVAGCNTIQGAGTDIERGGEKIQDAAGKAKN